MKKKISNKTKLMMRTIIRSIKGESMNEQLDLFDLTLGQQEEQKEERLPQESKLTPRQWNTYNLIKFNSLVLHRKTTQREIYEKVSGYEWDSDEKTHDHCPAIWTDIKDNNESLEHDKIIIFKNFEYWIGSERETQRFLRDLWKALAPRLHRYWAFVNKTKMDGIGKLLDKNGNPLNEKATLFHECFNEYDIGLQQLIEKDKEEDKQKAKEEKEKINE